MARPTVVTLSSIPPRFKHIRPTLQSILGQSLPVQEIRLYIPASYRRFQDWDGSLPEVPEGVTIHRCDRDVGPATKVLPAARDLAGQDIDILFCDDDKIYDKKWHARFKRHRARLPGTCLVEAGENLPDIAEDCRPTERLPRARRRVRKPLSYRVKRLLSLFRYKSSEYLNSGFVDILSGHGGVMVKPDWLDAQAWDIPDILWTVDDPWLSGHLERKGVPIWLIAEVRRMKNTEAGAFDALLDLVEQGHGRVEADVAAIDFMRKTYGIWGPEGCVTPPYRHMTKSMRKISERAIATAQ